MSLHRTWTFSLVATAWLAACGGGVPDSTAPTAQPALAYDVAAPLLDDDGQAMPSDPRIVPADPQARTQTARYARPDQAAALEVARPGEVIQVVVRGSGADAAEQSVATAQGLLATRNPGEGTPVFVAGRDLRTAAAVADRLAQDRRATVWLVTP